MKNKQLYVILLFIFCIAWAANKPDWVQNNGCSEKFPSNKYVVGFGLASDKDEAVRKELAEQRAKTNLSGRFLTKIQSELISSRYETEDDYHEQVLSTINSQTSLTLIGTDTRFYADQHITYALVILEIAPAIQNYRNRLTEITGKINDYLKSADQAEKSNNLKQALVQYRKTFPLFIDLGETQTVLNLLGGKSPFNELDAVYHNFPLTQAEVETRIQNLIRDDVTSIAGAAVSLAEQLVDQATNANLKLLVYPLTFQDTEFGSEFSAHFQDEISRELTGKFVVLTENSPNAAKAARLTGNYRIDGNICRVQVVLTNPQSGEKLAAAAASFDKSVVDNRGIALMPRNWQQAMEDGRVFYAKDVVSGKLSLEAWTNKGNKNLILREDDESTLLVRVNKPCYLQVFYHLADGMRVLMYNNYYIDISKVNRVVALPDTFEVCPPFGVERWPIFANTDKFPDVPVKGLTIDGEYYDNILDEELEKYTMTTRGMKKKKPAIEMTERTITLTTVKK